MSDPAAIVVSLIIQVDVEVKNTKRDPNEVEIMLRATRDALRCARLLRPFGIVYVTRISLRHDNHQLHQYRGLKWL